MIIFRGKTPRCVKDIYIARNRAIIKFQKNAWSTASLCREWLDDIWHAHVKSNHSILIWDEFSGHTECDIHQRDSLTQFQTIPPTCTAVIQPIDVCLAKPFKDRLRSLYSSWRLTHSPDAFPKVSKQLLTQWVVSSWADVPTNKVQNSFRVCGFSNP